jgi:hypothetical protein
MATTILLGLVLVESAVETFWRGSPLRVWILAAAGCWALAMIPAAMFLQWGGRLFLTTAAAVGLLVFAAWRLVPSANPNLVILTVPYSRLVPSLVLVALLLFAGLVMRFRVAQRVPVLSAVTVLLTIYCILPFAFAVVYGTPIADAVRGIGYWTTPPLLAQGGFLALQGVIPLGCLLAAGAWLGAIAGRARRTSAVFPAVCLLVFASTILVGSVELARAGIPNLLTRFAPDWLPAGVAASQTQKPATGAVPAAPTAPVTSGGLTSQGQAVPGNATSNQVELAVDGVKFASAIGGREAPAGQTFVVVRTAWKRMSASAPSSVPSLSRHLWLLADNRYAEPLDDAATAAVGDHLSLDALTLGQPGEAVTGQIVFRTAANASYLALALLDAAAGNALVAVKGRPIDAPPVAALGPSASNDELTLTITDARWSENAPATAQGMRYLTLSLRAVGRAPGEVASMDFWTGGHLQTDQGQAMEPQPVTWLARPFPRPAAVLPGIPNEGQLTFLLPADIRSARFILRPPSGGVIELPFSNAFGPARPER